MFPDISLLRFRAPDGAAHLGLIHKGLLYDLSLLGKEAYLSLTTWLQRASGRVDEAIAELLSDVQRATPVGPVSLLAEEDGGIRLLKPVDHQEVWACGVTYEMSREARMRESEEPTIYGRVYEAERPEIFFKATPHRVVGHGESVAIRGDAHWNVPEAELTLLCTPALDIVGYCVGNDMSSRDIEGENPLYLPQAKVYDRSCALGPVVCLATVVNPLDQQVVCRVYRGGGMVFEGETHTSKIARPLEELVHYLGRCNSFPAGVFVMTGTGIVPPDTFSLQPGDTVEITFDQLGTLRNPVIELPVAEDR